MFLNIGDRLQQWRQVTKGGYISYYSIGEKLQEAVTALETSYKKPLQHWRQVTIGCYSIGDKLQEAVTALETNSIRDKLKRCYSTGDKLQRWLQYWRQVTRGFYSIGESFKRFLQHLRLSQEVLTALETSYKRCL